MGSPCSEKSRPRVRSQPLQVQILDGEEQQQSDQQREDAECFSHCEAEDQAAELAVSSGWVAQCARQVAAEDVAEAESRTSHAEASQTCADVTCCFRFHVKLLVTFESAVSYWRRAASEGYSLVVRMNRIVQVHARKDRKHICLNERDKEFQTGQSHRHEQRQDRSRNTQR